MTDPTTAKVLLAIARGHLDRPCNHGSLPLHVEVELLDVLASPELEHLHLEARALLNESRGLS